MFTFSNKPGNARARLSTTYPRHNPFTSPTNEGWSMSPEIFIPQTVIGPDPSTTMAPKVDLELRLGQPGTGVSAVRETKIVSHTTQTYEVPEILSLTLGNKNWGQGYSGRGRSPIITGRSPIITEGLPTRSIQVQPTQTQGVAGSSRAKPAKPKKRDYYGPCVRCNMLFETSQLFASHMGAHYKKEETEEQRKARLAKKKYKR